MYSLESFPVPTFSELQPAGLKTEELPNSVSLVISAEGGKDRYYYFNSMRMREVSLKTGQIICPTHSVMNHHHPFRAL